MGQTMNDQASVITPYEGPFYHPDWRFHVATLLAGDKGPWRLPAAATHDKAVLVAAKHIRSQAKGKAQSASERPIFGRVGRWAPGGSQERVGRVIEALLLTEAPFDALATDMGCSVEELRHYEQLHFNVRDAAGNMALSAGQKAYFATEGTFKPTTVRPEHLMWRRVAVNAGYQALIQILELGKGSWTAAPPVDLVEITMAMAKSETLAKLAAGGWSTGELARLEGNRIKDKIAKHMTGEFKMKDEGMQIAIELLQALAPKMVSMDLIRKAQAAEAGPNMHHAQAEIDNTDVEDNGIAASDAALDRTLQPMKDQFARMQSKQTEALVGTGA
jgi:hypothetical protein